MGNPGETPTLHQELKESLTVNSQKQKPMVHNINQLKATKSQPAKEKTAWKGNKHGLNIAPSLLTEQKAQCKLL